MKEENSQKVANLMSEIQAKDEKLIKIQKDYKNLEKLTDERVSKTEKVAEEKSAKLQEDFLKEYEAIVQEKKGKYHKIKHYRY